MAITLTVLQAQVDSTVVALDAELSVLFRWLQIKAALERYGRDKPDIVTTDVTGDGGRYYAIETNLTSWSEGQSFIKSIQYPAPTIASDEVPVFLEDEDYDDDYWQGGLRYLFLPNHAPGATETMRIEYTASYPWSKSATATEVIERDAHGFSVDDYVQKDDDQWRQVDSIAVASHQVTVVPDVDNFTAAILEASPHMADFHAIGFLAASYCAQAIADKYSRTTDSTISADSVDHLSRAQQWSSRAMELLKRYYEHLKLSKESDKSSASGAFVDWDTAPGWPGNRDYLFHGRRTR